jgi:hypothetical protein
VKIQAGIAWVALGFLVAGRAGAYGEKVDTYPSMQERQIHLFTDMLRVEPMAFWDGEQEFDPVRPVVYNHDLNRAAFAHAFDMKTHEFFSHDSYDGTSMADRVTAYYPSYTAISENIAMGQETAYVAVFHSWLHSEDGHRENMLSGSWVELGTGYTTDGSDYGQWWVQDFGARGGVEEPYITSGIHWPENPLVGESVTFYAAYYDPDGTEPFKVQVAVGDACLEMEVEYGEASMGVYAADLSEVLQASCVPYKFVVTFPNGDEVMMPTEGALVMNAGESDCDDYTPEEPQAECVGWVDDDEAGGCEPRSCETNTNEDILTENDVERTEYGTCDQRQRSPSTPFPGVLVATGVLLAWRRLIWSRR